MKKSSTQQITWSLLLATRKADETLQNWLYRTLRQGILDGRLQRNYLLPSTRFLASQYGLARGTVQAAYSQLLSEGYLVTQHGSGTRVNPVLPDDQLITPGASKAPMPVDTRSVAALLTRWGSGLFEQEPAFPIVPRFSKQPFFPHTCDITHFPVDIWRRLHMKHLGAVQPAVLSQRSPQGLPALRQAIVEHLAIARGVVTCADNIVIVNSVQQALDICLRLIVEPKQKVWMEDPGYPGARQIMQGSGATIVDVPVDGLGVNVSEGIRMAPDARLAYVTPSRQAPMGVALTPDRRLALLEWAKHHNAYIFEDDYDSEYRFIAKPIPALKSMLHGENHVILSGTFSKLLFPALGLAYVVLPSHLTEAFNRAVSLTSRSANGLAQSVLADFMAEGYFGRHIRRMRKIYAGRAKIFQESARQHLHDVIDIPPILAGLDVVGILKSLSEQDAIQLLSRAGVEVFGLSRYTQNSNATPGLVMGFAAYTEEQILDKIIAIARLIQYRN